MKKTLLTLGVMAATAFAGMAIERTISFTGGEDLFGLERQIPAPTVSGGKEYPNDVSSSNTTFLPDLTIQDHGVDIKFERLNDAGGFALAKSGKPANSKYDGICICGSYWPTSSTNPQITVTVPGAEITQVKFFLDGSPINVQGAVYYAVNDKAIAVTADGNEKAVIYKPEAGVESAVLTYPTSDTDLTPRTVTAMIFVRGIEVTYTTNDGRTEPTLSFNKEEAEAIMGQSFTAPTLNNPAKLPMTWSSSNEKVATVDANGNITPVAKGLTIITASTEGNDEYGAGSTKYTLRVIPMASNLKEAMEVASATNDMVYMNFPLTVTYCNSSNAYVVDAEGTGGLIHNTKNDGSSSTGASTAVYEKGAVVPAGWVATTENQRGDYTFKGLPEESTETVDVVYPYVESVSFSEEADKVVILRDVTFTSTFDGGEADSLNGKISDGTSYKFDNTYRLVTESKGTFNVTCIVKSSTIGNWLIPVAFGPEVPETFDITFNVEGLDIEVTNEEEVYSAEVKGECSKETVTMVIAVPEGWDGFVYATDADIDPGDIGVLKAPVSKDNEDAWYPMAFADQMGLRKGNTIVFPVGQQDIARIYLYSGDKVYANKFIYVDVDLTKTEVLEFPEEFEVSVSSTGVTIAEDSDDYGFYINLGGECDTETFTVTIETPEGWDGFLCVTDGTLVRPSEPLMVKKAPVDEDEEFWAPVDEAAEMFGMTKGNTVEFKANGEPQMGMFYLYKGDKVYTKNTINLNAEVKYNKPSAVETIESVNAAARYFTLQGVEVVNPTSGIYVKVLDGKASKVTLK